MYQTIPDDIDFSVESDDESTLHLSYSGPSDIQDLQEITVMIESILMTAKAYGYESVDFENMPIEKVGNYPFSETIEVPIAVNPIFISN